MHTKIVVLKTLPVSPNHATLNQSLIFFSHIVNTTGSHKYLSRFWRSHSLSVLAAAQLSRWAHINIINDQHHIFADNFCVKILNLCCWQNYLFLLTQRVKVWGVIWCSNLKCSAQQWSREDSRVAWEWEGWWAIRKVTNEANKGNISFPSVSFNHSVASLSEEISDRLLIKWSMVNHWQ
jgi:hypothetical protein